MQHGSNAFVQIMWHCEQVLVTLCRGFFTPGHNNRASRNHDNVHGAALRPEFGGYSLAETFAEVGAKTAPKTATGTNYWEFDARSLLLTGPFVWHATIWCAHRCACVVCIHAPSQKVCLWVLVIPLHCTRKFSVDSDRAQRATGNIVGVVVTASEKSGKRIARRGL